MTCLAKSLSASYAAVRTSIFMSSNNFALSDTDSRELPLPMTDVSAIPVPVNLLVCCL